FCMVSALALFTSQWWEMKGPELQKTRAKIPSLGFLIATVAVVIGQLILGAIMRHTHSGMAVPDFPLAYGQLFPSLAPDDLAEYNEVLIRTDIRLYADGPITAGQIAVHILHRYWAVVVAGFLIITCLKLWKLGGIHWLYRVLSSLLTAALVTQAILGAYVVLSRRSEIIATAHQSLGALILMITVIALLSVLRLRMPVASSSGVYFRLERAKI
ncbi:MAG TPA: COX15/CtaA family protein, partial [Bacteroidota bacterium]|nr:COX15/CtaA family protein [Bacteroidota bacterium]